MACQNRFAVSFAFFWVNLICLFLRKIKTCRNKELLQLLFHETAHKKFHLIFLKARLKKSARSKLFWATIETNAHTTWQISRAKQLKKVTNFSIQTFQNNVFLLLLFVILFVKGCHLKGAVLLYAKMSLILDDYVEMRISIFLLKKKIVYQHFVILHPKQVWKLQSQDNINHEARHDCFSWIYLKQRLFTQKDPFSFTGL